MNYLMMLWVGLGLAACAAQPPVQEMAAARASVHMAKTLAHEHHMPVPALQSAEQALQQAAQDIQQQHYQRARSKALQAKRKAQAIVRHIQHTHQ